MSGESGSIRGLILGITRLSEVFSPFPPLRHSSDCPQGPALIISSHGGDTFMAARHQGAQAPEMSH